MDEQRKKALIENHRYTWDEGVPCVVGGWKNQWASVSPSTGWSYGITWIDLERIASGDHDIPKSACWFESGWWLGVMTDEEAELKRAEWRQAQDDFAKLVSKPLDTAEQIGYNRGDAE